MNRVAELLARHVGEPAARGAQETVEIVTQQQIAEARALRMNRALDRLCALLVEPGEVTEAGCVRTPLPWGRAGAAQWGLTQMEAATLRGWLVAGRVNRRTGRREAAPISYDPDTRRWWLLGGKEHAIERLGGWRISAADVLKQWPAK